MSKADAIMEMLRFDRSFNAGQVAAVASSLLLIGGLIFQQGRFQAATETRLDVIAGTVKDIRTETSGIKDEASAIRERLVAIETTVGLKPPLKKQGFTLSPYAPDFPPKLYK